MTLRGALVQGGGDPSEESNLEEEGKGRWVCSLTAVVNGHV